VMMLPLNEDESIDETALAAEVEFAIVHGASAICAPGFATEFYKLTDEERRKVIALITRQVAGRVPVIASTGCGSAYATIELSRYAESVGAEVLMVTAPKWVPLGAREQAVFFERVCRNVSLPVMIQDADFSGGGLPASLVIELAERCPNLQYAKLENVLAGEKCAQIVAMSKGKVQVLYGMAGISILDGLAHGISGVMPGPAFVEIYRQIFDSFRVGDNATANKFSYSLQPYLAFAVQHLELLLQMEKKVLVRRGIFKSAKMREPTVHFDVEYQRQMDELVSLVVQLCEEIDLEVKVRPAAKVAGTTSSIKANS
jgi:dihydrodipicolinate synthase/N-acetylneuraminate lyase